MELGCGCALVGLVVARDHGFERVVVTDQEKVLADVTRANVAMNVEALEARGASTVPRAMALDWEKEEELGACGGGSVRRVVLGTDVLFSVPLVGKLVRCVERLMRKKKHSVCYVCVQRRSPDAHEEFLRLAKEKFEFFQAEDVVRRGRRVRSVRVAMETRGSFKEENGSALMRCSRLRVVT